VELESDLVAFIDAPLGKYVAGKSWLYFYPDPTFSGFVLWGRLDRAGLEETLTIPPEIHRHAAQPHRALIDGSRVTEADNSAFDVAATYVNMHRAALGSSIAKLAVVYPPGVFSTIAAGFFQVIKVPFEIATFDDPLTALRWLAVDSPEVMLDEIDERYLAWTGTDLFLTDVRTLLETQIRGVSLAMMARELATSERSLQRRLGQVGTSFQREVALARVRLAQRALARTDASLTEIAYDVGCSSLQQFSTLFRKVTGETPQQFRQRPRPETHVTAPTSGSAPRKR
jgi:AraC-like DNA-binding protein